MASPGQSLDELIMCVVGMGFEVEDAQQAVKYGKLTVEEAVEWILSGKPAVLNTGPRLRLNQPSNVQGEVIGSNPFSNPQPAFVEESAGDGGYTAAAAASQGEEEEHLVVSRVAMNDRQRAIKEQFQEKQRSEAQKEAKQAKIAKKKAHDLVLKEIAKDREMQKVKTAKRTQDTGASSPCKDALTSSKQPAAGDDKSLIQIRLPDGRLVRQTFSPQTSLAGVWAYVVTQFPSCDDTMMLMQPFPRQEYGAEHMQKSLQDLGLVPSGSLVLKKKETSVHQAPQAAAACEAMEVDTAPEEAVDDTGNVQPVMPPLPGQPPFGGQPGAPPIPVQLPVFGGQQFPFVPGGPLNNMGPGHAGHAALGHQWGQGHKLLNVDPPNQEGDMEVLEVDDQEVAAPMDQNMNAGFGGPGPGAQDWDDHMWGEGHALIGEVLAPGNLPHHQQAVRSLAGDAAAMRFVNPPDSPSSPSCSAVSAATHQVSTLTHLVIRHVAARMVNTRPPITTLQGLPTDIAMKLIAYLIEERLLKSKTLSPFLTCHLRSLILDCYPYTTNELLMALRLHANLTHLSLGACPLITDQGLQPLKALKRLKYLSLRGNRQITNSSMTVISAFESLVTLVLEETSITDAGISTYAATKPQNLQHLILSKTDVSHEILKLLGTSNIPQLKSLSLEGTKVANLTHIAGLRGLETVNLCNTPVTTETLANLNQLPALTALNIANTPNVHGDLALEHLQGLQLVKLQLPARHSTSNVGMSFIERMQLVTLDLTNFVQITDDGAPHIGNIQTLKKLRLSNTGITDVGMQSLRGLTKLEELYLDRTAVGDDGVSVVADFTSLHELSISETRVSNRFLKEGILNNCQALAKLNMSRTQVSNKGVECLRLIGLSVINLNATRVRQSIEGVLRSQCPHLRTVLLVSIIPATESEEEEL